MLAKIAPSSNDFLALARYLVHGKPGTAPDPKRVAWIFTQNLPADDPELAAKLMQATAELSPRTRKAAYHLMIAWEKAEAPTPEAMQEVARQTLELAGLAEHQALVMGHGDKPHPHLHILLNRVHPGTGRAWKTSHDYARLDAIMRELAEAHGFRFVPAHTYNPDSTAHLPKKPNSRATYAAKRGATTDRLQWSREEAAALGDELSEDIGQATTWADIDDALISHGLRLEPKGNGLVAGNATSYVKLSAMKLTGSAKSVLRRLHADPVIQHQGSSKSAQSGSEARSIFTVDGVDIVRAFRALGLADSTDLHAAIAQAQEVRAEKIARRPMMTQILQKVLRTANRTTSLSPMTTRRVARRTSRSTASRRGR